MERLIDFKKDDSGAVTVDWVVLTAAIVGIAIAVIGLISGGVENASTGINDELDVASAITFGGDSLFPTLVGGVTGKSASDYLIQFASGNSGATYGNADLEMGYDAPDDFVYTGAIDTASNMAIYVSDDGNYLAIDGQVINRNDYDSSGAADFNTMNTEYVASDYF